MSKHNHNRASVAVGSNAPTTGLTQQPIQEKTMEANMEASAAKQPEPSAQEAPEVTEPTAKQLAAAEEENQLRALKLAQQEAAPPPEPAVDIRALAAQGRDALHEQFRRHNENQAKIKEYVPPPRTQNQMSRLQEELEAGARAVERAKAQQAASRPVAPDANKEGFTTPVYRPNDVVPNPVTNKLGAFGPDA